MRLKKRLGQNFLKCERILNFIAKNAEGKEVLEIGGGDGRLSKRLRADKLYIVEKDRRFCEKLREIGEVICEDFLKVKPFRVEVIVGNVPYYISSKILFRLLSWDFEKAILMFQKEFAEKMIAKERESSYGRLSVTSQYYFSVKILKRVKKECFIPIPKVDSAIVEIRKRRGKDEIFDEVVRKIFSLKNKKIKNVIPDAGEFGEKRGRELSIEEIERIVERFRGKKRG